MVCGGQCEVVVEGCVDPQVGEEVVCEGPVVHVLWGVFVDLA